MGMSTLFVMDYQSGKMFSKMVPEEMQSEEIEEMLATLQAADMEDRLAEAAATQHS